MWILYMEESGEEIECRTKKEAVERMKDIIRFHRENDLDDEVFRIYKED